MNSAIRPSASRSLIIAPASAVLRPVVRPVERATAAVRAGNWGWLPVLSVVGAVGVLLLALAHTGARYNALWAQPLYWLALVVVVVPISTRLLMPNLARQERIGLVMFMGAAVYFAKLLHSPIGFTFFDEFLHWRTANDIMRTGHLFKENSLLPVSPLYPGLEIATNAIQSQTGLTIFQAGALLIGFARLILVLALYLLYEQVSHSPRTAGVAAAIYMANPHFVIFDGQFAYESLALAIALTVVWVLSRRLAATGIKRIELSLIVSVGLWALVASHHATSYMIAIFLVLWTLVVAVYDHVLGAKLPDMLWVAGFAVIVNVIWLLCVSSITIGYLAPHLEGALTSVVNLIAGEGSDRELFKSASGIPTPLLEKLTGLGGPGLIMLSLPVGLFIFWRRYRRDATAFTLALAALSYPVTLAMRMTGGGWEVSARSSVFVFIPLAFILALAVERMWLPKRLPWLRSLMFAPYIAVLFCSGIIGGWSPWARMPWPYMVGADTRSIEPQGLAAAAWASEFLGPDNRFAADRINMTLLGTYGEQRLITDLIDKVSISGIFLAPRLGPYELEAIQKGRIRYLAVDGRISTALPLDGHYYESWEKLIVPYSGPIDLAVLRKFDTIKHVNRIFDSGDLTFYDIGALGRDP